MKHDLNKSRVSLQQTLQAIEEYRSKQTELSIHHLSATVANCYVELGGLINYLGEDAKIMTLISKLINDSKSYEKNTKEEDKRV